MPDGMRSSAQRASEHSRATMLIRTVRKPGEPGTQKLLAKFGNRLVSVRYRYDPVKGKRYKTVELIVAEEDWLPSQPRQTAPEKRLARIFHQ